MNWKLKSAIQRSCASLPAGQESLYYFLQRTLGSLRRPPDPLPMLSECARLVRLLADSGVEAQGARVMEVGTGRRLEMPIGFYLAGARSVITFDLHRYLKPELVMQSVAAIRANRETVTEYFGECEGLLDRLDLLCSTTNFSELIELTRIEYRAPADAAATGLPDGSIDIQMSYTVFEHIPGEILKAILMEANRILAPDGVALHHIDPSDHFSHEDPSISSINFLQFPRQQWDYYADNQFAYHNRLRADEFSDIYEECGHRIAQWIPKVDQRSIELLRNGFALDAQFRGKPADILCTTVLQVLSRPRSS
jgi:SAM-dependent methyltransferase